MPIIYLLMLKCYQKSTFVSLFGSKYFSSCPPSKHIHCIGILKSHLTVCAGGSWTTCKTDSINAHKHDTRNCPVGENRFHSIMSLHVTTPACLCASIIQKLKHRWWDVPQWFWWWNATSCWTWREFFLPTQLQHQRCLSLQVFRNISPPLRGIQGGLVCTDRTIIHINTDVFSKGFLPWSKWQLCALFQCLALNCSITMTITHQITKSFCFIWDVSGEWQLLFIYFLFVKILQLQHVAFQCRAILLIPVRFWQVCPALCTVVC